MDLTNVSKLTFTLDGSPWCRISVSGTNPESLIFTKDGSPWYGHSGGQITILVGNIKRVSKVDWGFIKKLTGTSGW